MDNALLQEASNVAGAGSARAPESPADLVDGIVPGVVVAPSTPEGVAETLAWASASRLSVVIRGGGTKDAWGRAPRPVDVLLSLARLDRVLAHEAGDLTATVQAGARLSDVNRILRQRGQWLPLDPPHLAAATIGGVLATNDAGPLRHRYGTPRDMVIGMSIAMTDGVLSSSGGRVVKNVAGYDIGRLMTGSHGSLAAIVSATFKLSPVPPVSRTIVATVRQSEDVPRIVEQVRERQCEPDAMDVRVSRAHGTPARQAISILVRYASVQPAVEDALASTLADLDRAGATVQIVEGSDEERVWTEHDASVWTGAETVLRLSWRPAEFARAHEALLSIVGGAKLEWTGRAAVGSGLVGLSGQTDDHARIIAALRASPLFDHVVIVRSSAALRAAVDVWKIPAPQQAIWQTLKQACDPAGTLNASRGPL